jgi:hypothetical protein
MAQQMVDAGAGREKGLQSGVAREEVCRRLPADREVG